MIEKIAKYLILSLLGLSALTFVAVLVLDDDLIESTTGPVAGTLLGIKHGTLGTVSDKSDSFVYWIRTKINDVMNFSPTDRTPRVVMRIPPPPEKVERMPAQIPTSPEPVVEQPAAPTAAMQPKSTVAPEQASQVNADQQQEHMPANAPPPPPEPVDAPTSAAMPSALGHGEPAPDGAPNPAPVTDVSEQLLPTASEVPTAATEQAALPDATSGAPVDGPPPPPAPEEARPGEADYQQGLKYYNGADVEQNFGKAAQFFLKAGEAGHVGAQYNLGIMNYTGQTGGQDFANAAKWFERAANNGHTQAQYNLGFLYYEGKGVEQNLKVAFDWINRAAEQGYAKAIKARDAFKQAMPEMFEGATAGKAAN